MTGDSQEFSGRDGPVGEPIPPLRGRSLPLPGLKHLRLRKRLSQKELARRAGQPPPLQDRDGQARLQPRDGPAPRRCAAGRSGRAQKEARGRPGREGAPKPSRTKIPYRNVHQAYLRLILKGAVGSAYAAMDEREVEERCEQGTWEGALEIVQARKREIEYLRDALGVRGVLRNPDLSEDVRVPGGGAGELPRPRHPPARDGPQARALRGGPRGGHKSNAGSALTLFLAQAVRIRSLWCSLASCSMASAVAPLALKRATAAPSGERKTNTSGSERSRL
jgi:hypothetical protein